MTEYLPGGRRRIDRVLDPLNLEDLASLTMEEVRVRRADADQEEVDLSYARRLLQGRLDLLADEQNSRANAHVPVRGTRSDAELAATLSRVLADPAGGRRAHGLGRHLTASPSRVGEHRREAERAVADLGGSDPGSLDDLGLVEAIERLRELESRVSRTRRSVQQVADLFGSEIARRYAEGEVEAVSVG